MKKLNFIISIVCCFLIFSGNAQINFNSIPKDLELIPRNNLSEGHFIISGTVTVSGYNQVRTKVITTSGITTENKLSNIVSSAFSVNHKINAALVEYKIEVYLKSSTSEVLVKTINNIVSGDVFIICGQSNALAGLNDINEEQTHTTNFSNPYCRTIGTNIDDAMERENYGTSITEDYKWARPSCIRKATILSQNPNGFIGAWGLKLQNDLANQTSVPICIINGAKPGTYIAEHYATSIPSNPNNLNLNKIYDRLYKKLDVNGLRNYVKGIFWYQGESDGEQEYGIPFDYNNRFAKLRDSWKQDFPNYQKIFMFQINAGCSWHNNVVREMQRRIPSIHSDVEIMSTLGYTSLERSSFDACHYTLLGYNKIADKMLKLVKSKLYDATYSSDHYPPKITAAYYSIPNQQICIEFDRNIAVQGGNLQGLVQYFYGEYYEGLNITNISLSLNKIYLDLHSTSYKPKKICYGNNDFYYGPWITSTNTSAINGAFSFFNYPLNCTDKIWRGGVLTNLNSASAASDLIVYKTNGTTFFKTSNNTIEAMWWNATNNKWELSQLNNASGNTVAGSLAMNPDGKVFFKTTTNNISYIHYNNGTWQLINLSSITANNVSGSIVISTDGKTVFYKSLSNTINALIYNTKTYSWYLSNLNNASGTDVAGDLAVNSANEVFYKTTSNYISYISKDNATNIWNKYELDHLSGYNVQGNLTVSSNNQLFYRTNNSIHCIYWDNTIDDWNWSNLNGSASTNVAGDLAADNTGKIFYRNTSGNINCIYWDYGINNWKWSNLDYATAENVASKNLAIDNNGNVFFIGRNVYRIDGYGVSRIVLADENRVHRIYNKDDCYYNLSNSFQRTIKTDSQDEFYKAYNNIANDSRTTTISPNPSNGFMNIESSKKINTVSIYTLNGHIIYSSKIINENNYKVDVSNISNGIYILKLKYQDRDSELKKISIIN